MESLAITIHCILQSLARTSVFDVLVAASGVQPKGLKLLFICTCLDQLAIMILLYKLIEFATPNQLDDIKASTTEGSFVLLHHLGVATHGPIQALVVAIHDEDHVVQSLAPGHGNGGDGLGLVHLTIAHKGPNAALGGVGQAPQVQVAKETSLIDSTCVKGMRAFLCPTFVSFA